MFQNSGLGNAVSPLTSLTTTFRIPVLLIVTWRGQPGGRPDEPQHELMGQITPQLLELMGIPWQHFPREENEIGSALDCAFSSMATHNTPYALILSHGAVASAELQAQQVMQRVTPAPLQPLPDGLRRRLPPDDVLRTIQDSIMPGDVLLATTGFTGRALYALDDRPNQLYMVGSMGCVSSLGLGLAMAQPHRRIVVIDGDGSVLMRMGALTTLGYQRPANLLHIVLDNGVHDSTGGQSTVSSAVDFVQVARGCGYPIALRAETLDDLEHVIRLGQSRLTFVHVLTKPRNDRKLPRPEMTPAEAAQRMRRWMGETVCV
jgi:phosphonopyruvate decarboxylase